MAIIALSGAPNLPKYPAQLPLATSTTYTKDQLVYRDTTNSVVKMVTSSVGTTENLEGIFTDPTVTTASSGSPTGNVQPIYPGQLYLCDCTNNTATNQLLKNQLMTDAGTIANSSSTTATTLAIFVPVAIYGANTDKKLIGYFVKVGQVAT
jgi:hypothetical protein